MLMIDHMNQQELPYDGIAGFSQGYFLVQIFFKIAQYFQKRIKLRHPIPSFVIDFAAAKWPFITFDFKKNFIDGDVFLPNVMTIHYQSEKDPLYPQLKCHLNVESPIVIKFDGGHRPPKILDLESLIQTADFLGHHYYYKYGKSKEEIEVIQ